jgi:hypothetical protein
MIAALILASATGATAQLRGHYIPGFTGLRSGTQPPPGISLVMPVHFYTTDDLRDDDGEPLPGDARANVSFVGLGLAWVINYRILDATLGGSIIPVAFMKSRIEGPSLDVPGSFAFTDIIVQPVQLGWRTNAADALLAYSFFIPTGEWTLGDDDNGGLGMWSNVIQAGATLHLDRPHRWSFSALGSYEMHGEKNHTDIQVGDILTVEGGLGRSFQRVRTMEEAAVPTLVTNLGAVYYGQFKITSDLAPTLTPLLAGRKDRVWGAGLEGNVAFPTSGWMVGLRVAAEFAARNRTQGWMVMVTAGYVLRSLVRPPVAP